MFAGCTPAHLGTTWHDIHKNAMKMFPELKASEVTSEVMQQYLRKRTPRKISRKDLEALFASYDEIAPKKYNKQR